MIVIPVEEIYGAGGRQGSLVAGVYVWPEGEEMGSGGSLLVLRRLKSLTPPKISDPLTVGGPDWVRSVGGDTPATTVSFTKP